MWNRRPALWSWPSPRTPSRARCIAIRSDIFSISVGSSERSPARPTQPERHGALRTHAREPPQIVEVADVSVAAGGFSNVQANNLRSRCQPPSLPTLLVYNASKITRVASEALPIAAIGAWRHADKLMEDAGHVGVAREAAFQSDFGQRHGGFRKQLACALHAQVQNIVVWRMSGGGPKHPGEVDGTVSAFSCHRLEGQIVFQIPHALFHTPHRVPRQGGRCWCGGSKPDCLCKNEKPKRKRMRQVIRVQPLCCRVFVDWSNEKPPDLPRRAVLNIGLQ